MAQHDYVIANGTGAAVRSDLNAGFAAIVSQNSGATAPSTTYAYQSWADTSAGVMKMRNGANNAWITLYQLDGEWSTIAFENGTAAAPSIYFKDSGTDTGIYSPGADQVGISTGGTARITVDGSGNVNIDSNTLYVDAANNRVGFGTSSPTYTADVAGTFRNTGIARIGTGSTTTLAYFGNPDTAGNKYITFERAAALTDIVNIQGVDAGVGVANIALQASGGNVNIGTTSSIYGARLTCASAPGVSASAFSTDTASEYGTILRNVATSGNNGFALFETEATPVTRGSITYNRAGGVVAYNITSDYRSKSILGNIEDAGTTIDAFKVYRGLMNGATIERPMLIAHEAQEVAPYCVTGEKDAEDDNGNPIYQQMDHQVLIPLLIAEIQQLRIRLSALEGA